MPYGIIKVDQVTFTNAGVDQTISVSGIVASISGNITATGTISGDVIRGGTLVSGATVTGTAGLFGTITGNTAGFTTVTGVTVTGNVGSFTTITGGTVTLTSGVFSAGTASLPSISFESDPNTGIYRSGADQVAISTNGTGRLFVDASGNVGVSDSSPSTNPIGAGAPTIVLRGSSGSQPTRSAGLCFISQDGTGKTLQYHDSGIFYTQSTTATAQVWFTNNTERLRITSAGLVGIGTSSPGFAVDISAPSDTIVRSRTNGNTSAGFIGSTNDGTNNWFFGSRKDSVGGTSGTDRFNLLYDVNAFLTVTTGGNVGIGTSSPTASLDVGGAFQAVRTNLSSITDTFHQYRGTPDGVGYEHARVFSGRDTSVHSYGSYLAFYTEGKASGTTDTSAEKLRIDSSGRVGIGTTSPNSVLQVNSGTNLGGILVGFNASSSNFYDADLQVFRTGNGTERARIDSSGRLLVGTSSARSDINRNLNIEALSTNAGITIVRNNADNAPPVLEFGKTRAASVGGNTAVVDGDGLGMLRFYGANGTDLSNEGARISAEVDGTPFSSGDTTDLPSRLVFSTTADGASSPTERWRYSNNGETRISNMLEVFPITDNACLLGKSSFRWSAVWAANGTIQTSDQRAKTDVTTASLGSEFIKSLRPVSYKWIEGGKRPTGDFDEDNNYVYESVPGSRTHWGFIAQEVKQAIDATGVDFGGWVLTDKDDPDSQQALRYDQFIAPLTKALQEALERIETLEAKVAALEAA